MRLTANIFLHRPGTEVRMWRNIQLHRRKYKTYQFELAQSPVTTNGFVGPAHEQICNSYDSTSSATTSSSNYDSCCGGDEKE